MNRPTPRSNNEPINKLDNLRIPQREIFTQRIFDPRRVPESNWKSYTVKNMANALTEYNINQGDFQFIMGLLANIESLGEIKTMDIDPKNNTYEDYQ